MITLQDCIDYFEYEWDSYFKNHEFSLDEEIIHGEPFDNSVPNDVRIILKRWATAKPGDEAGEIIQEFFDMYDIVINGDMCYPVDN